MNSKQIRNLRSLLTRHQILFTDVAREAGVTPSMISKVFSRAAKSRRVEDAAMKLVEGKESSGQRFKGGDGMPVKM